MVISTCSQAVIAQSLEEVGFAILAVGGVITSAAATALLAGDCIIGHLGGDDFRGGACNSYKTVVVHCKERSRSVIDKFEEQRKIYTL